MASFTGPNNRLLKIECSIIYLLICLGDGAIVAIREQAFHDVDATTQTYTCEHSAKN
jgi:hypothetical protein